jgi:metal-sulfur cluster biosynthetic enzyme
MDFAASSSMSLFDRLKNALSPTLPVLPTAADGPDTAAVLEILTAIQDPELGIDLANLGLLRRVARVDGRLQVDLTATTPACPLGPWLLEQVKDAVEDQFPGVEVEVRMVWEPPWRPEQMSAAAREKLGR